MNLLQEILMNISDIKVRKKVGNNYIAIIKKLSGNKDFATKFNVNKVYVKNIDKELENDIITSKVCQ